MTHDLIMERLRILSTIEQRHTALLAALDALVRKMRADANTTEDAPIGLPWSHGVRVTARQYATELETILATHREGR